MPKNTIKDYQEAIRILTSFNPTSIEALLAQEEPGIFVRIYNAVRDKKNSEEEPSIVKHLRSKGLTNKIEAIKEARDEFSMSLRGAKDWVEAGCPWPIDVNKFN